MARPVADLPLYYSSLFQQTAANLLAMRPSLITDRDVLNLEILLNEAYLYAIQYEWSVDLQNAILDGLAHVTELNDIAQRNPDQPRNRYFYRNIKKLVSFLQIVAVFLIDEKIGTEN